jgi:hypothetical protein
MTRREGGASPDTLKARIEAADRATVRGTAAEALRLLLDGTPAAIAPDHDHTCPECGQPWSHLDESCGDLTSPMRCGWCEDETGASDGGRL